MMMNNLGWWDGYRKGIRAVPCASVWRNTTSSNSILATVHACGGRQGTKLWHVSTVGVLTCGWQWGTSTTITANQWSNLDPWRKIYKMQTSSACWREKQPPHSYRCLKAKGMATVFYSILNQVGSEVSINGWWASPMFAWKTMWLCGDH